MLKKISRVVTIPGVDAVTARPASLTCTVPPPPAIDPDAPPASSGSTQPLQAGDVVYVYVPKNYTLYTGEETRTASVYPAPAGYTCTRGTYLAIDPSFPNGATPIYETRCYWNYP